MPAEIDSMFSVREVPWHGEGRILGEYPGSWAEARKEAGLEWDPTSGDVYTEAGINEDGTVHFERIPGWQSVSRSDNGKILSLNMSGYQIIDHREMGEIVEAVLEQPNVKWETAGSLEGGRKVWCLALLDEPIELPGDNSLTLPYLAITNRHDGKGACAVRATTVRVVCANTFRAAELEGERTGSTYSFVHSSGWRDRIPQAQEAVTGARREFRRYEKLATALLGMKVTDRQREMFVVRFIPEPPDGLISDRVARNIQEARTALRMILDSPTTVHVQDSVYGLVQAAGEYLDHVRSARTWESRLNRTLLRPEPLKARALTLAKQVVNA
jgi:phage/plasmid-like protein (TIGR03299 family)